MKLRFEITTDSNRPEVQVIKQGLTQDNSKLFPPANREDFCLVAWDEREQTAENQVILGGAVGLIHWRWLYLSHVWIRAEARNQKLGSKILDRIEDEMRGRAILGIYLDTFSQDARRFYEKHGFFLFGELPGFPEGGRRFFLQKPLE